MPGPKRVASIHPLPPGHWVGDGFPVSTVFSPRSAAGSLSPYILMDYAKPARFAPSANRRGVGSHPHRGFETVTVIYQGELEHRDSAGHGGRLGPGDVQWMTAASGVLHEEMHSEDFTKQGGVFEVAQLWVNLPARCKRLQPRYQDIRSDAISVARPDGGGSVRVVAGEWSGIPGAAETFTPVILWDAVLPSGGRMHLPVPAGYTAALFVRRGSLRLPDGRPVPEHSLAVFDPAGAGISVDTERDAMFLLLGGLPIDEPVVAHGPFVMNTREEIQEAVADFQAGRFGTL